MIFGFRKNVFVFLKLVWEGLPRLVLSVFRFWFRFRTKTVFQFLAFFRYFEPTTGATPGGKRLRKCWKPLPPRGDPRDRASRPREGAFRRSPSSALVSRYPRFPSIIEEALFLRGRRIKPVRSEHIWEDQSELMIISTRYTFVSERVTHGQPAQ